MKFITLLGCSAVMLLLAGCGSDDQAICEDMVCIDGDETVNVRNELYRPKDLYLTYHIGRTVKVADPNQAYKALEELIRKYDGFYVNSSSNEIEFAVPCGIAEELLANVEALGQVAARTVQTRDITAEVETAYNALCIRAEQLNKLECYTAKYKRLENRIRVQDELTELRFAYQENLAQYRRLGGQSDNARITVTFEQQ